MLLTAGSCSQKTKKVNSPENLGYVGDILPNVELDDPSFKRCFEGHIFQYFNDSKGLLYEGEKPAINTAFEVYIHPILKGENGLIRIRFVVNCRGETGRFRLMAMDNNYKEKSFPESVSEQLMEISKSLKGWKTKYIEGGEIDYYQYLIFKIEDAQLIEIMP